MIRINLVPQNKRAARAAAPAGGGQIWAAVYFFGTLVFMGILAVVYFAKDGELSDFELRLIHGQMPSADKADAMRAFSDGAVDVLVATSVIEVGIDVPNASVIVIEDADRYGISQLHQLRGRVGRGEHESHCLLFGSPASRRLRLRPPTSRAPRDSCGTRSAAIRRRSSG